MNPAILFSIAFAVSINPILANENAAPTTSLTTPATASPAHWGTNLTEALEQAKQEGKCVLLVFTGSDWCPPCKMLKQNVFDAGEFSPYAEKNFVLVEIDLPNGDHVSAEQKELNQKLAKEFKVQGFPTSLVLSADGIILGGFIGYRTWAEAQTEWNQALANKAKVDTELAAALKLTGLEQAKALNQIAKICPENMKQNNVILNKLIIDADVDDTLGLKAAAQLEADKKAAVATVSGIMAQADPNKPKDLLATLDKQLARTDLTPALKLVLTWARFDTQLMNAETEEEINQLKAQIIDFGAQNPSEEAQVQRLLSGLFSMPTADILKKIKAIRKR